MANKLVLNIRNLSIYIAKLFTVANSFSLSAMEFTRKLHRRSLKSTGPFHNLKRGAYFTPKATDLSC